MFQTGAVLQAAGAGAAESPEAAPRPGDQGARGRHQETAGENQAAQGEARPAQPARISSSESFCCICCLNI